MTLYDANLWLAASNAENGVDWLWMGTGKDGKDVPLNYSSWALDEPRKKGKLKLSKMRFLQHGIFEPQRKVITNTVFSLISVLPLINAPSLLFLIIIYEKSKKKS